MVKLQIIIKSKIKAATIKFVEGRQNRPQIGKLISGVKNHWDKAR